MTQNAPSAQGVPGYRPLCAAGRNNVHGDEHAVSGRSESSATAAKPKEETVERMLMVNRLSEPRCQGQHEIARARFGRDQRSVTA